MSLDWEECWGGLMWKGPWSPSTGYVDVSLCWTITKQADQILLLPEGFQCSGSHFLIYLCVPFPPGPSTRFVLYDPLHFRIPIVSFSSLSRFPEANTLICARPRSLEREFHSSPPWGSSGRWGTKPATPSQATEDGRRLWTQRSHSASRFKSS